MMNTRAFASFLPGLCAAFAFCTAGCATNTVPNTDKAPFAANKIPPGMILDLGEESSFVQVTPEYSNAVLVALLPRFSNFAEKLGLPVPQPITQADVARFNVMPYRLNLSASVVLKNDWMFNFQFGYVNAFASAHEMEVASSNQELSDYGEVKISSDDAIKATKEMFEKLGIPLEDVFADQKPKVSLPIMDHTNAIYPYRVEWLDPFNSDSVDIKVDPHSGNIISVYLSSPNLVRPPPKINVVPPIEPNSNSWFTSHIPPQKINPEYARQLVPIMFKAIDEYAQKLSLPVPLPLTTNNVARVKIYNNDGWPHCEINLTNGWQFIYRHTMVNGYYSPTVFNKKEYSSLHVKAFEGRWNLTTNQAIELVKTTLAKLNYPTNNIHMAFAPDILCASGDFRKIIPRYYLLWNFVPSGEEELRSKVEAEVNADNGNVESLYYDDKAYWNSRPPIDVPISIGKYPPSP